MPAIAMLPPTEPIASVVDFYAHQWADVPQAQGSEGKKVFAKAEEVFRHWNDRAEVLLMHREEADAFSYEHVPANRVSYVKTRYVYAGKGYPQRFDLDDE